MSRCMVRLAAAAALSVLAACGVPDTEYFGVVPEVKDPRHLRWCNSGEPEALDPSAASSTTSVKLVYALFDGLTSYDKDGMARPSLATSWDISPDLRRFTFHLHDKARWSNGRPLDAYDVAYHVERILHPLTASVNADGLVWMKNADGYGANRVRKVLRDTAGLRAGDVVEIVGVSGKTLEEYTQGGAVVPDTNHRRSHRPLGLRDLGAAAKDAYGWVPPAIDVTVIELSGGPVSPASPASDGGQTWAYVHWNTGDGLYGWVPLAELDVEPNADVLYRVKPVARNRVPGLDLAPEELATAAKADRPTFEVRGKDLLMLPEVLGIRIPDRYTVVLETADPTPYVVQVSNQRSLRPTPREVVSRWPRRWTDVEHIVTSGPMHLAAWKQRNYIELVRSPTYWDQAGVKLDRLTAFSMDDQAAATNYYFSGGCDALTGNNVPSSYLPVLSGEKRGGKRYRDYIKQPYLGIYFATINTKVHTNRHLRRALSYAVDRRNIAKFSHGGEQPTAQYTPGPAIATLSDEDLALCGVTRDTPGVAMIMVKGELCYVPPPGLDYDPDKARAELALARQELGSKFPSKITYKFNTGVELHKLIAEYLQQQWSRNLGLTVELESQEWKTFLVDTRAGNYDIGRMGWIGNFPDAEAEFDVIFLCGNPNNRPQWCNQDFQRAWAETQLVLDRKQRLAKLYQAEKIMIEDAPVIPLYVYTQKHLQKPYVRDLAINFVDQPPLWEAWLDPDWQRTEGR